MINDLNFASGPKLLPHALKAAENIHALKKQLKENKIHVIYVNDNYGKWQSDFYYCLRSDVLGNQLAKLMKPDDDDYFVLKPTFSGFFQTPLDGQPTHLKVNTLILTGVTADMCVQFTANDAYIRNYTLLIALPTMKRVIKADIQPSTELFLCHEKR